MTMATDGMDVLFTARPLAWRVSPPAVGDKKGFFTAKPLAWRVSSPIVRPLLLLEAGAISPHEVKLLQTWPGSWLKHFFYSATDFIFTALPISTFFKLLLESDCSVKLVRCTK